MHDAVCREVIIIHFWVWHKPTKMFRYTEGLSVGLKSCSQLHFRNVKRCDHCGRCTWDRCHYYSWPLSNVHTEGVCYFSVYCEKYKIQDIRSFIVHEWNRVNMETCLLTECNRYFISLRNILSFRQKQAYIKQASITLMFEFSNAFNTVQPHLLNQNF